MSPNTIRSEISLMAAMSTFLTSLFVWHTLDPEAAGFFLDGGAPDWARYSWWTCSFIVLGIIWHTRTISNNIIGTLMCMAFGPVTLLTFVYQWASLRLWPSSSSS